MGRAELAHTAAETEQTEANAAQALVDTALTLLAPYREQIVQNGEAIRRAHERLDQLWQHVESLEQIISSAGLEVPPRPSFATRSGR